MPSRNRVTPLGDIVAIPLRGAWTGNRGILHKGRDVVRFHGGDLWITCALRFKGRHAEQQWAPHHFTWLYFHDEAVSFAAGHRPCGECRHRDYTAFRDAWARGNETAPPSAREMNRRLHSERIVRGTRRRQLHELDWRDLPDGAFVLHDGTPALVLGPHLVEWAESGYRDRRPRPVRGQATVVTPPSTLAVLRAGYPVQVDESARC